MFWENAFVAIYQRHNVKIFLLLPWLIILGLGISYTDDYLADIQQAKQASLSITISSEIDHLTDEL